MDLSCNLHDKRTSVVCVHMGPTRPAELAGRALHNLVYDAGCNFVPAQIFPDGKYILFEGCTGS